MTTTPVEESVVNSEVWAELPVPVAATTSRVLVNNRLLRIVEFAMDAGQELTDHASSRAVTVHIMAGDVTFTVAGTPHAVTAGDVIYLAPGERHAVVAESPCRFALVLVDLDRD